MSGLRVAIPSTRHGSDPGGRGARPRAARPDRRRAGRLLLLLALVAAACGEESPEQPDLVLITVDRLAADRLDCFGGPRDEGASICALGEGGVYFAWAASPGTGEASTAATVLTGLAPREHGLRDAGLDFLADAHETLAESLARAGYATAAFVASPRLNRIRRLDQGFEHFDDRLAFADAGDSRRADREGSTSVELSARVRDWLDEAPSPWFVWIHADREDGPGELDRLVSRLASVLDADARRAPGVLFVALRGEAPGADGASAGDVALGSPSIDWRSHRVPIVWRPPGARVPEARAAVSRRLASLPDVAVTLRAVARAPLPAAFDATGAERSALTRSEPDVSGRDAATVPEADVAARSASPGLDLRALVGSSALEAPGGSEAERTVLLETPERTGPVGLASERHLYTRRQSPDDGWGRPLPPASLRALDARYATLPTRPTVVADAALSPGPWQRDLLDASSPVPRLERALARALVRVEESPIP
ncbi:MAG: sulfatase-like hydrolase/transferase [Myxococcales bacterium]|nr:sulfatase-like hydrolase/transferase [Myxococcales bacterium]